MESIRGALQSFRSSTAFITFVIAYAVFTDQFLFAAIIPVYPYSLQQRVGVSKERVQFWVSILLGVFGIACVVVAIPWGWYTDRSKSRRTPFLIGLLILLGSTLMLWFTPTIAGQVVGRALQGFASTVVWTTGLAVLVDTCGKQHVGEYMGYVGIALNAGSLTAPFLGGIVFAKCGYHAVFGLIIAIVVIDILLRLVMVEQTNPTFTNANPCEVSIVKLESAPSSIKKEPSVAIDQISISSQSTLVQEPSTTSTRLPPILRMVCSIRFLVALWGIMVLALVFSGFQATLPLFVHSTFHWDAIGGGLIFVPLSLPAIFGPVIGRFTDRHGGRWFAVAGYLLFCISLVCLRFISQNSTQHKALLCVLLVLVGSCMALVLEPLFAEITSEASRMEKEDEEKGMADVSYYGSAYAWFNIAWASGNFLGPLMAGMVMDAAGWGTMTWALGLLGGVSALPVGLWCGGWYFAGKAVV
ncbi:Putative major facilitator superfamily, MFS transporter superfamily [Septoria linicola]|uniref:Major facilitator superfamily, MFS transporter superfamily n=1 Tax=Septoria linicola TaxID=215465 RepID=A0A9Q9AYA0_9PEZI|nr:putative major facilitator superfamily, MFS transporter superfamily [Septoria linicola]USW55433.1 Putative major facilitator superfamily, MFS transporter superfamily [Septoria linicola]